MQRLIRKNQHILNLLNMLTDGLLIFLSYSLAMYLRLEVLGGDTQLDLLGPGCQLLAAGCAVLVVFLYYLLQLYGSYRFKANVSEGIKIFSVNGMVSLAFMAALYLVRASNFPRLAVVLFWVISSLLVMLKRMAAWGLLRHYRRLGYNQKHVAILGNGHLARQYLEDIRQNPQLGVTVVGYISREKRPGLGKCLGSYEELEKILERRRLDELIIALEPHETRFMKPALAAADKEGTRLSLIPFYNDYIPPHPTIEAIGRTRLINMRATPLDNLGWAMVKRLMDLFGSLALILLTSPIMAAAAVGVKLSSPGPVLFRQKRIGKDKKPFTMLKFRSMSVTKSEKTGWTTRDDPRKTKFGSLIRKFSIDELPQLFNVLAGDMSLVGPRPEVPFHVRHFKEEVPLYLVRQQVKPGMTGWAQVNGLRGDTSIEARVKYDIWYIENWSLGLDIRILLKTAFGGMVNQEEITPKRKEEKADG